MLCIYCYLREIGLSEATGASVLLLAVFMDLIFGLGFMEVRQCDFIK